MCERIIVVCILLFLGDLARAHFMVPSKTIQIGPKENQKTPAWATNLWREGNRWFGNAQKNPAEQGKLAEADEEPEPIHSQLERIEMQRTIYTKITNNHVPVPRPIHSKSVEENNEVMKPDMGDGSTREHTKTDSDKKRPSGRTEGTTKASPLDQERNVITNQSVTESELENQHRSTITFSDDPLVLEVLKQIIDFMQTNGDAHRNVSRESLLNQGEKYHHNKVRELLTSFGKIWPIVNMHVEQLLKELKSLEVTETTSHSSERLAHLKKIHPGTTQNPTGHVGDRMMTENSAISHSSEGLANEEQIHSGLTHNPMDHVGVHMLTERDVALTSEPSPSNVQEKGNSGKSSNQEWRIYDDPDLINFGAKKHLKETDVPVEAKLATDTISHSSEGLANEEQIHSGLTHNPMDHVGGHMSTERDVALTNEPSPSNVQEKGNSGKSNNQEWRIYDDPDLINFGAKKHLKETDVPVEAKLATDISFSAANIEPFSNELALALSSLLDEYSDTAEYSESQSSV